MPVRVIARRGEHTYLVRDDEAHVDRLLNVERKTLSFALLEGAWIKDPYWEEASMPDAVLAGWLDTITPPPQPGSLPTSYPTRPSVAPIAPATVDATGRGRSIAARLDSDDPLPVYSTTCAGCLHLRWIEPGRTCDAFPDGIPATIWRGDDPHTTPAPGDHGITYDPLPTPSTG